jgi:hypothetical protein
VACSFDLPKMDDVHEFSNSTISQDHNLPASPNLNEKSHVDTNSVDLKITRGHSANKPETFLSSHGS